MKISFLSEKMNPSSFFTSISWHIRWQLWQQKRKFNISIRVILSLSLSWEVSGCFCCCYCKRKLETATVPHVRRTNRIDTTIFGRFPETGCYLPTYIPSLPDKETNTVAPPSTGKSYTIPTQKDLIYMHVCISFHKTRQTDRNGNGVDAVFIFERREFPFLKW